MFSEKLVSVSVDDAGRSYESTFPPENVLENVFDGNRGIDPAGIDGGDIVQGSARTRRLDFSTGEEVRLGLSGQLQDTGTLWNASRRYQDYITVRE